MIQFELRRQHFILYIVLNSCSYSPSKQKNMHKVIFFFSSLNVAEGPDTKKSVYGQGESALYTS